VSVCNKNIIIKTVCLLSLLLLLNSESGSAENNVYRELVEKGVTTYEDGCRAISCFTDVDCNDLTFDELVLALKERGIIGKRWKYKAERPLTRGQIAYMECKVFKVRGGLAMRAIDTTSHIASFVCKTLKIGDNLAGPDIGMYKRYAYLECQDMGTMPPGHKKKYITGHDLLASLYRIEQHIKAEEMKKKAETSEEIE
jgi:hypothetical protein